MTTPVCLDIETLPTEAALAEPYPEADRQPPSNYKRDEAITAWREADEAKWRDERVKVCSLNPRLGRVLCIGIGGLSEKQSRQVFDLPSHPTVGRDGASLLADTENREAATLSDFWTIVGWFGRVVTFNGRTFDLPFLVLRSPHHGITPTLPSDVIRSWFAKYRVTPHCDVRGLLTNWDDKQSGTLEDWCRFVGVPYENGHSGADIYQLYRDGKFAEIAAKCRTDVEATRALYEKVGRVFASEAA